MRHMGTAGDVVTKIHSSCINSVSALKLSGVVHKPFGPGNGHLNGSKPFM